MKNENKNEHVLAFIIDGKKHESNLQYITGAEIRRLGQIPQDFLIYLSVKEPGQDELIKDEDKVDLARPSIEHFYSCKPNWDFTYDQKKYDWQRQYISGNELRNLKPIPEGYQIFLVIKGPWEDELIKNADRVDLARQGLEHFYSCKPNTNNG